MDERKKKIGEHAIGFALSVAASYFVIFVQMNDIFSWPPYVYFTLSVFVAVLFVVYFLFLLRFVLVNYRDSKQAHYIAMPPESMAKGDYSLESAVYKGLFLKLKINKWTDEMHDVDGVFCPKKECRTELNARKTFFGKYKFECPACSFKITSSYNSYTLKSNFRKVVKAKQVREREKRIRQQQKEDMKRLEEIGGIMEMAIEREKKKKVDERASK